MKFSYPHLTFCTIKFGMIGISTSVYTYAERLLKKTFSISDKTEKVLGDYITDGDLEVE